MEKEELIKVLEVHADVLGKQTQVNRVIIRLFHETYGMMADALEELLDKPEGYEERMRKLISKIRAAAREAGEDDN